MKVDLGHKLGVAGLGLATVALAQHPWPMGALSAQQPPESPSLLGRLQVRLDSFRRFYKL